MRNSVVLSYICLLQSNKMTLTIDQYIFRHIAADMQLICFGLAVHIATKNRGRSLALILLLLLGMIGPALQVWWQNLDGTFLMIPEYVSNKINIL